MEGLQESINRNLSLGQHTCHHCYQPCEVSMEGHGPGECVFSPEEDRCNWCPTCNGDGTIDNETKGRIHDYTRKR